MNQPQLLAQIAELRKVYRALGEITEPVTVYHDDIRFAKLHIERAIQGLERVIQDNYERLKILEKIKRLIRQHENTD